MTSPVAMHVRYENTMEDLIAFNLFHLRTSPHMQRSIWINTWAIPVLAALAGAVVALNTQNVEWAVWALLFAVLYVLIYRKLSVHLMERSIKALLTEGSNEAVLCEHALEVTPAGLVERTPVSEATTAWQAIQRIEDTDRFTFIYTQATHAHVVPRDRVVEGDCVAFCDAVRTHAAAGREALRGGAAVILFLLTLLLPACGPDEAPDIEIPSWAHVAPEQIAEAKKHGVPVAFENEIGMRFVLIPAGNLAAGVPGARRLEGVGPHYMQITEITNREYRLKEEQHDTGWAAVAAPDGRNPLDEDDHPAGWVGYGAARDYTAWLSSRDTEREYRLPTNAEWEWACRAGTNTNYTYGDKITTRQACIKGRRGEEPRHYTSCRVASFAPNAWGLYDVHGNVSEWVSGWVDVIQKQVVTHEAIGAPDGKRIRRGGGWTSEAEEIWSTALTQSDPDREDVVTGFRLVSPLPEPGE